MTTYSLKKGLWKMGVNLLIVGLPVAVTLFPEMWQNLTLSGAALLLVNYLKVKYQSD